ncbi:outer membrane beta-barrel protein [Helicobacter sp. 11S03491-1]|uniref:outer membrane beta-barrel protein n=1 Tax=Helicobacter sp. 11S03491-1 TaxID=1476196 RepID=UPI000BA6892B|nr:outer membrane beta-barrel protein [Helicobacter sp. 11S03491-1]
MKYFLLPFLLFFPLWSGENNLFVGFGGGQSLGQAYKTSFWQQATKDNSGCAGGTCIGNKTSGSYASAKSNSFMAMVGDEFFVDQYKIFGLRIYGSIEYANASLGNLKSKKNQEGRDTSFTTITGTDSTTGSPTIGVYNMKSAPPPQEELFHNGVWNAYSVNLDFFLNLPLDSIIKMFYSKMFFFKIGVYAGGGVEYATLRSSSWENKAIEKNEKFFASGSGFFANLGGSIYLGRHNRINIGIKIPYYSLNSQNWHNFGSPDPWEQQLLRQNFDIKKNREWRVSYVFLF